MPRWVLGWLMLAGGMVLLGGLGALDRPGGHGALRMGLGIVVVLGACIAGG